MEKGESIRTRNKHGGNKTKKSSKSNSGKLQAKLLNAYYGKPIKDMKLIAITGTTGKTTVAHYVHEILKASGEQVAVFASDQSFKVAMLHKFLSDAWKAGANYVIITAPAEALRNNVFYDLPVHVAAMTDFLTNSLSSMTPEEYLDNEKTLFDMRPEIVILNQDDLNYSTFSAFKGTKSTLTFGQQNADIKILNSKLYKKGTEATISLGSDILPLASFVSGETAVHYMAAATAIAYAMGIKNDYIIDGIANYDPEEIA